MKTLSQKSLINSPSIWEKTGESVTDTFSHVLHQVLPTLLIKFSIAIGAGITVTCEECCY